MSEKNTPRRYTNFVIAVAFVAAFVLWQWALMKRDVARLRPPREDITFSAFGKVKAKRREKPQFLAARRVADGHEIIWVGELRSNWSFPSGPSCYVFGPEGQLKDWVLETGDGSSLDGEASYAKQATQLSVEEALKLVYD